MQRPQHNNEETNRQISHDVERFLELTFEKLPAESKVLIALFAAINSSSALAQRFNLPDELWTIVRPSGGPLVGQSEEVNWLKGVCDGMLLIADHA